MKHLAFILFLSGCAYNATPRHRCLPDCHCYQIGKENACQVKYWPAYCNCKELGK